MSRPDARLVVFGEGGETIAEIPMIVRPVVADDEGAVVLAVELQRGGVIVEPEWVGNEITLEISPSAVTRDRLTAEIIAVAHRFEVPVG